MEYDEVDLRFWTDTRRSRHHAEDKRPQKRAVTNDCCLGPGVQLRLGLRAGRGGAEGHARHESGSSADRLRRGGDSDSGRIGQGDGGADGGICHRPGRPQAAELPDRAYGGEDPRDRRRRQRRDVRRTGPGRGDPFGHAGRPQGATEHAPYIARRGIKFNIPLDARTPSYSDAGDAAQQNIPEMWSMDFWREFLDEMARHRFNVLTLWNLHPFPSMVKVPEYPDVALADVMRTTVKFDSSYSLSAKDMVRPAHLANLETLKKMTIEEKIEFWREVMQYAHDRGIEVYLFTWNIFVWGAEGKYGITSDQDNPTTIDYFRKSVRETLADLSACWPVSASRPARTCRTSRASSPTRNGSGRPTAKASAT